VVQYGFQLAEKGRFVSGHDFSRAAKPFIFRPEPALAGGTVLTNCNFFSGLFSHADNV